MRYGKQQRQQKYSKMMPLKHFAFGVLFSFILIILFPNLGLMSIFLFLISNSLIDSDHYLYYLYHKNDFNPWNAYHWFVRRTKKIEKLPPDKKKKHRRIILIFHGIEIWIVLLLLSLFHPLILFVLFGFLFHTTFDLFDIIRGKNGFESIFGKLSQTYVYIDNKNKKEFKFK